MTIATQPTALDACKTFVRDALATGPRYVKPEAIDAGHSEATVRRALKELAEAGEIDGQGAQGKPTLYHLQLAEVAAVQPSQLAVAPGELERLNAAFNDGKAAAVYSVGGGMDPRRDLPADEIAVSIDHRGRVVAVCALPGKTAQAIRATVANVTDRELAF